MFDRLPDLRWIVLLALIGGIALFAGAVFIVFKAVMFGGLWVVIPLVLMCALMTAGLLLDSRKGF